MAENRGDVVRWITVRGRRVPITPPKGRRPAGPQPAHEHLIFGIRPRGIRQEGSQAAWNFLKFEFYPHLPDYEELAEVLERAFGPDPVVIIASPPLGAELYVAEPSDLDEDDLRSLAFSLGASEVGYTTAGQAADAAEEAVDVFGRGERTLGTLPAAFRQLPPDTRLLRLWWDNAPEKGPKKPADVRITNEPE